MNTSTGAVSPPETREREPTAPRWVPWVAAIVLPAVLAWPWVELMSGSHLPDPLPTVSGLVLVLLLVTASVTDLIDQTIKNWTTYTAVVWGLGLQAAAGLTADVVVRGTERLSDSLVSLPWPGAGLGLFVGLVVPLLLYGTLGGGAGDVKLMAGVGLLIGKEGVLLALCYGFILAAVGVLGYLLLVAGLGALRRRSAGNRSPAVRGRRVSMGPFLTCGVVAALFLKAN